MKTSLLNFLKYHVAAVAALVAVALLAPACLDVDDDDNEKITEAEKALVAYLDANYPGQWKQYASANLYYVPLVENPSAEIRPKVKKHFVRISYNMWKQDDYSASWRPSDRDLLSTSDSTLSANRGTIRNYLHGGPELYPYINGLSDYAAIIGEMRQGETYRIFMAPSLMSGFKDYTRVMDLTLDGVTEWNDAAMTAEETAMFKSYRIGQNSLRNLEVEECAFSYIDAAYYYGDPDDMYEVESAVRSGTLQIMTHREGYGDPLTNGGPVWITYSYGYLQRNYQGRPGVSYVPIESVQSRFKYNIGGTDNKVVFVRGFVEAMKQMKKGSEATVFVPAHLGFGWKGVTSPMGFGGSELYTVPPMAPLVFRVSIYSSAEGE
ncbi:MAG: FKBP-type peptidyl-prolyl cis-trans isomerase [Bacteroidales bacterium]|nr:FKBP-type peptidyl-prolyl cis-trans isomerase [Bacteroidales bacterium]